MTANRAPYPGPLPRGERELEWADIAEARQRIA